MRSAIAGRVGDRTVRVGQYVQPGTRLMTIVPVQDVYLVANFKETQIGLMRAGQPATIHVDALVGHRPARTVVEFLAGHRLAVRAAAAPERHRQLHQDRAAGAGAHSRRRRARKRARYWCPGLSVTVEGRYAQRRAKRAEAAPRRIVMAERGASRRSRRRLRRRLDRGGGGLARRADGDARHLHHQLGPAADPGRDRRHRHRGHLDLHRLPHVEMS